MGRASLGCIFARQTLHELVKCVHYLINLLVLPENAELEESTNALKLKESTKASKLKESVNALKLKERAKALKLKEGIRIRGPLIKLEEVPKKCNFLILRVQNLDIVRYQILHT